MFIKRINSRKILFVKIEKDAYDFEIYATYKMELRYLIAGEINPLTGNEKAVHVSLSEYCKTVDTVTILCKGAEVDKDEWPEWIEEMKANGYKAETTLLIEI